VRGARQVILDDAREDYKVEAGWLKSDHQAAKPAPSAPSHSRREESPQGRIGRMETPGTELTDKLKKLHEETEKRAAMQDLTAADLSQTGLHVDRMAAVFMDIDNPSKDVANFVNGRGGLTLRGNVSLSVWERIMPGSLRR